jgi:DNA-binding PadR family transcriptional regulator
MSVRRSLLAILDQGPCYGYQLRTEFDRRTGARWPLNVGQIYNTLERLERDGLVRRGDADGQGHVYWQITDAGSADVAAWFASPVVRTSPGRDEVALKLAVAATLPGVDAQAAIAAQRKATLEHLADLRAQSTREETSQTAEDIAHALVLDSLIFAAEAEAKWLDHLEDRLSRHPQHAISLGLTTERPKRGRPAKPSLAPVGV